MFLFGSVASGLGGVRWVLVGERIGRLSGCLPHKSTRLRNAWNRICSDDSERQADAHTIHETGLDSFQFADLLVMVRHLLLDSGHDPAPKPTGRPQALPLSKMLTLLSWLNWLSA